MARSNPTKADSDFLEAGAEVGFRPLARHAPGAPEDTAKGSRRPNSTLFADEEPGASRRIDPEAWAVVAIYALAWASFLEAVW